MVLRLPPPLLQSLRSTTVANKLNVLWSPVFRKNFKLPSPANFLEVPDSDSSARPDVSLCPQYRLSPQKQKENMNQPRAFSISSSREFYVLYSLGVCLRPIKERACYFYVCAIFDLSNWARTARKFGCAVHQRQDVLRVRVHQRLEARAP